MYCSGTPVSEISMTSSRQQHAWQVEQVIFSAVISVASILMGFVNVEK
jgi:hypothetical protein